ncbi:MAG: ComF family protein [Pseudomonadota bacterium]
MNILWILSENQMNIFTQLIDLIYPPRCHICLDFLWRNRADVDRKEIGFCKTCFGGFSEITSPFCPICRRPFETLIEEDHLCENCLRKRPFYDAMGAPYRYEGCLREAVHQFKYAGKTYLGDSLGLLVGAFARRWLDKSDGFLMMPVPLHTRRLRERGFNQSLVLARFVASMMGIELEYLSLRRVRDTQPQAGLKRDERRKNVRKAFELMDPKPVRGRTVVLVDDVATTGSTLNECARVIKKAGARKVLCLVLARTTGY